MLATPLDMALSIPERRRYRRVTAPRRPVLLVTGAPRSGTTVLSQVLLHHLPVTYINNLTTVFPRAPIVANRLFGRWLQKPPAEYRSFYGRTSGFAAENDALHIWDRWLGTTTPTQRAPLMPLGVEGKEEAPFLSLLAMPARRQKSEAGFDSERPA